MLTCDADLKPPRELHPIFFGSFDWHSCVHGWWTLLTLRRLFPHIAEASAIAALADDSFTEAKVAAELAYLDRPFSRGFERPYGWAWLLYLHLEARRHGERWGAQLEPLARAFAQRLTDYLAILTYPIRVGTHFNSAFAMILALEWADAFDAPLAERIRDRSRHWFGADRDCQAWEPGGDEFLSPALIEALCMARTHKALFPIWFEQFLPRLAARQPHDPVHAGDRQRPQRRQDRAPRRSEPQSRVVLAQSGAAAPAGRTGDGRSERGRHLAAAAPHLSGDYMGEHWLASFALLALLT